MEYFPKQTLLNERPLFTTAKDLTKNVLLQAQNFVKPKIERNFLNRGFINKNKINLLYSHIKQNKLSSNISNFFLWQQLIKKNLILKPNTKVIIKNFKNQNLKFLFKKTWINFFLKLSCFSENNKFKLKNKSFSKINKYFWWRKWRSKWYKQITFRRLVDKNLGILRFHPFIRSIFTGFTRLKLKALNVCKWMNQYYNFIESSLNKNKLVLDILQNYYYIQMN